MTGSNIDPIRAEIMRLESLQVFRGGPWMEVIMQLRAQDHPAAEADAMRRMETARDNCKCETCQMKMIERAQAKLIKTAGEDLRQIIEAVALQAVAIETEAS